MNLPISHEEDVGTMLKPRSRRPFELSSATSSEPPTPPADFSQPFSSLQAPAGAPPADGSSTPPRTRSILNLTSSTLFGIYQPTGFATDRDEPSTPWGTGAETPIESRNGSFDLSHTSTMPDLVVQTRSNGQRKRRQTTISRTQQRKSFKGYYLPIIGRVFAMFSIGLLYGILITRLHDHSKIVPVKVEAVDRSAWQYLAFWGVMAVLLGEALPWVDGFWAPLGDDESEEPNGGPQKGAKNIMGTWNNIVRPIGAFVGIAFAIRKLPWESTLQLSLTLALANPAIWYLIDRSPPGFVFSTFVALGGTALLLGTAVVPTPSIGKNLQNHIGNDTAGIVGSEELVLGLFGQESVGVATWIASVLFVSAVCFGNIGRRLAPECV